MARARKSRGTVTCKVVKGHRFCLDRDGNFARDPKGGKIGLVGGVGATRGRKRRKARRKKRRGGPSVTVSRAPSRVRRSGVSGAKTFKAKKSYALTGLGKLRKGCRKIKKNGRTEYRCAMPGKKTRKRRK